MFSLLANYLVIALTHSNHELNITHIARLVKLNDPTTIIGNSQVENVFV